VDNTHRNYQISSSEEIFDINQEIVSINKQIKSLIKQCINLLINEKDLLEKQRENFKENNKFKKNINEQITSLIKQIVELNNKKDLLKKQMNGTEVLVERQSFFEWDRTTEPTCVIDNPEDKSIKLKRIYKPSM